MPAKASTGSSLRPQALLDTKWLKIELQEAFTSNGLSKFWNELVKNGEIVSNKPKSDPNSNLKDGQVPVGKEECLHGDVLASNICDKGENIEQSGSTWDDEGSCYKESNDIIDSWTWGEQPTISGLREAVHSLMIEQHDLINEASRTTLSSIRLQQRLLVLERYYNAYVTCSTLKSLFDLESGKKDSQMDVIRNEKNVRSSVKHQPSSRLGLAHIGARAAFSFACAFLRRAWKSGEDSDLCREFLQEALEALQSLPECSLFDESSVSAVWIDTVERVSTFLKAVVSGGNNEGSILYKRLDNVPVADQHLALGIYLELAFQRGSLSHVLDSVILLLRLWDRGQDNEKNSCSTAAPLVSLLRRFENLSESKRQLAPRKIQDEASSSSSIQVVSPTECFLRYSTLPEDDLELVDVQQVAVTILSYLDRFSSFYDLGPTNKKVSKYEPEKSLTVKNVRRTSKTSKMPSLELIFEVSLFLLDLTMKHLYYIAKTDTEQDKVLKYRLTEEPTDLNAEELLQKYSRRLCYIGCVGASVGKLFSAKDSYQDITFNTTKESSKSETKVD